MTLQWIALHGATEHQTSMKGRLVESVQVFKKEPIFHPHRWTPLLIALLAGFGVTMATSPNADAATIRARYSLSYLGLTMGTVVAVNRLASSTFESELDARVSGAATVFASYKVNMKANGVISQGIIQSSSFTSNVEGGEQSRTMRMSLVRGLATSSGIVPPFEDAVERVPVTEEHKRKVFDPLSAFIISVPSNATGIGPDACNRTLNVFDGFVRSDLALTYVRSESLKTKAYSGPVLVCSVRYVPIAGHNPNLSLMKFMTANEGIRIRLARIQDTPLAIVVSATVPMPLGTGVVELEELQVTPTRPKE